MNKEIMIYLYIEILYSSEKTKSMNLPKKKNAAQKKPDKIILFVWFHLYKVQKLATKSVVLVIRNGSTSRLVLSGNGHKGSHLGYLWYVIFGSKYWLNRYVYFGNSSSSTYMIYS